MWYFVRLEKVGIKYFWGENEYWIRCENKLFEYVVFDIIVKELVEEVYRIFGYVDLKFRREI